MFAQEPTTFVETSIFRCRRTKLATECLGFLGTYDLSLSLELPFVYLGFPFPFTIRVPRVFVGIITVVLCGCVEGKSFRVAVPTAGIGR